MSMQPTNEVKYPPVQPSPAAHAKWPVICTIFLTAILFLTITVSAVLLIKHQIKMQALEEELAVYTNAKGDVYLDVIRESIQDVGQLVSADHLYTNAGKLEDPAELFGKELNLSITTKYVMAKWDGCIKAGIDLTKVKIETDNIRKTYVVSMPEAIIISHEIDHDTFEVFDEKDGLYNRLTFTDYNDFLSTTKEAMEERAMQNGLLETAAENAEALLKDLILSAGASEIGYSVEFDS